MIFSLDRIDGRRQKGVLLSLGSHAGLIGIAVLMTMHFGRVRPVYRESRCCMTALYWTGSMGGGGRAKPKPAAHKSRTKPSTMPAITPSKESRAAGQAIQQSAPGIAAPQQEPTIGTGAGTENAEPAFPVYYPTPGVADRSLLPAVEQRIIVDVTVSALGDVTDEKLVQGLGNSLDQVVLNTVKGWRFHPATLDGAAVASVEELVFPFNRDYPSDDSPAAG